MIIENLSIYNLIYSISCLNEKLNVVEKFLTNAEHISAIGLFVLGIFSYTLWKDKIKKEKLGFVNWTIEKDKKQFGVGFIGNQVEYDKCYTGKLPKNAESKYAGIGIRLNQLKIERFLQEKFNNIKICSTGTAYPFHAKNGFKADNEPLFNLSNSEYNKWLKRVKDVLGLDDKTIQSILDKYITKSGNNVSISLNSANELFPLSYLKTGKKSFGDFPMILPEESLNFWKYLIKRQPILDM